MLSVLTVGVSVPSGVVEVAVTLMLCVSVRSTSVKVIVPVSVRVPVGVTSSVTAPVTSVAATSGASSVPVMVTLTMRSTVAPLPSLSVMVKVSILVWPAARYSTAEAATL